MRTPYEEKEDDGAAALQHGDRLLAHVDRIIDRQINKARGILPFNSILLAVLVFGRGHLDQSLLPLLFLAILGLVISSLICLWRMFMIEYHGSVSYKSFSRELQSAITLACRRAIDIEWATLISLASMAVGVFVIGYSEYTFASRSAATDVFL